MSMISKFATKCKKCGKETKPGDRIFKIDQKYWCSDETCMQQKITESAKTTQTALYTAIQKIHREMWKLACNEIDAIEKKPGDSMNRDILRQVFYKKLMDVAIHGSSRS